MKNLFRPLLVLTGCIVLASCVSQKQFKGLKTVLTKVAIIGEIWKSRAKLLRNRLFEKIASVTV